MSFHRFTTEPLCTTYSTIHQKRLKRNPTQYTTESPSSLCWVKNLNSHLQTNQHDDAEQQSCFQLLLTDDFVDELENQINRATSEIFIQLMTFDGDASGQRIADLLQQAIKRGVDVKILIDCFAKRFVSDVPIDSPKVREEAEATNKMYEELRKAGAALKFTRPNGPFNIFALARNHKKIFIVDNICFLGGINVSDHNFAWHDFNIKITDAAILADLKRDFLATFAGEKNSVHTTIITNKKIEPVFDAMLAEATDSIVLASPYALDIGLARALEKASAPNKKLITNEKSNFKIYRAIQPYLSQRLRKAGCEIFSYEVFSHAKFLLVDKKKLLIGSSNFGRHSLWCNEEICIGIEDQELINAVYTELISKARPSTSTPPTLQQHFYSKMTAYLMHFGIAFARKTIANYGPSLSKN